LCWWLGNIYSIHSEKSPEPHFYITLNEPENSEHLVLVNITDERHQDKSCILIPGDISFIYKNSVIAYEYAELITVDELQRKINLKIIKEINNPIKTPKSVLEKVLRGALISQYLEFDTEEYIQNQSRNSLQIHLPSYRH
jgi:hypothetical protein